jgi:Ca2+-binding RTX toxin-like protein
VRRLLVALGALGLSVAVAWPAEAQEPPLCRGNVPTILGTPGNDAIVGTPARDVIYADAGDDVVSGGGTGDVICGGLGNDYIGGGGGNDRISGEDGTDRIGGDRGNDRLDGGPGDGDRIGGGLGDDQVNGGPGNGDGAFGDLGTDEVNGGEGDFDLIRGDYGADSMSGGPGLGDVASFATAVPDRTGPSISASLATGVASGDGRDTMTEFEDLEGSAYNDVLSGDAAGNRIAGGPGNDTLDGGGGTDAAFAGPGNDVCTGFASEFSCGGSGRPARKTTVAIVPSLSPGSGLVVTGSGDDDVLSVSLQPNGTFLVRSEEAPLAPRKLCEALAPSRRTLRCQPLAPLHYLLVELGAGDDKLTLGPGLLAVGAVRVGGGFGDDVIRGGEEDDLFQASQGSDRLLGGAGSDGLLGDADADTLFGQPGDDLLAAGGPCGGGRLVGNAGDDNASFARTADPQAVMEASLEAGRAFIRGATDCLPTGLGGSVEDLEGTFGRDVLIGDDGDNGFFGQPGADEFYGRGGNDLVNARDGRVDLVIDCGEGSADEAVVDDTDPAPVGCEVGVPPEPPAAR